MATDEQSPETAIDESYAVTIPAAVREELGLAPGDRLRWHVEDGRLVADVVDERYGVGDDIDPVDLGETDALEVSEGYDWS